VRRPISSKPDTCTEGADVDAAGISVKVTRITRGDLPSRTGRNPGQGYLETDDFTFGRSQQRPYEPDSPTGKGLNT
jgi:hypothetical protein